MMKMTLWGVGPQIMVPSYLVLLFFAWLPVKLNMSTGLGIPKTVSYLIAFGCIATGITLLAICNFVIKKALKEGKLITTGVFSSVRNPMYSAHIFFLMPGICLLVNNALTLVSLLVAIVLFYVLIHREEELLENQFGKTYVDYKHRSNRLIPKLSK